MGISKGVLAENIVHNLFQEAGFKVYRYGYEYLLPELANRDALLQGEAASFIRHQPDFVVVNPMNEAFFVEVKYRYDGTLDKRQLFNYPKCFMVFLTKDFIFGQVVEKVYRDGVQPVFLNELEPFKEIPTPLIARYVKLVRRKLGDETFLGQQFENFFQRVSGKKFIPPKLNAKIVPYYVKKEFHPTTFEKGHWEKIDQTPSWLFNKISHHKAKKLHSGDWLVNGKHHKYIVKFNTTPPTCLRCKR